MTVSDIHFRRMDSEAESRRTSTASQLIPPLPPIPTNLRPWPELPSKPLIVQKLRGMSTGSPSSSAFDQIAPAQEVQPPIPEPPASAHREVAGPSTPFMKRMLGISPAALSPRHNRGSSTDVTKPSSESRL